MRKRQRTGAAPSGQLSYHWPLSQQSYKVDLVLLMVTSQNVPMSKRPNVKTSQVKTSQSYNIPSQNVQESKRPKSKRPKVKTSQVKTSQSQNVPSQNVPSQNVSESKRPKSKRPRVKMSQVKISQVYDKFDSYGLQTNGSIYDWLVGLCCLMNLVSVRTFSVMCDHTFPKLANHQIRHQAPRKVGCQPSDCMWSL